MPKLPNTDIEYVTLNDGRHMYMTGHMTREEMTRYDGEESYRMFVYFEDEEGESPHEPFPDDEEDRRAIFNTLRTHERTIELLRLAGHITPEVLEEARKIARESK
jgi:hypothetical protein